MRWLNDRLHDTVQELNDLVGPIEKKPPAGETHIVDLSQASSCVKKYRKEAGARTDPWTEAKLLWQ